MNNKSHIYLTNSKILGWFILIVSFAYAFYTKQDNVLIVSLPCVVALITGKQFFDSRKSSNN